MESINNLFTLYLYFVTDVGACTVKWSWQLCW